MSLEKQAWRANTSGLDMTFSSYMVTGICFLSNEVAMRIKIRYAKKKIRYAEAFGSELTFSNQ